MAWRTGRAFTRRGPRHQRKLADEVATRLTSTQSGGTTVVRTGGGGGGSGGVSGVRAYTGRTIDVYVYDPDNPTTPGTLIGSTVTDAAGYWEFDVASYCWTNSIANAFLVTILRDGAFVRHQTVPEAFWQNAGGTGYLPLMVSNHELHA